MRMFLIGMCDIFLILYLTSITNVQPQSSLTIDDFYTLKSMHQTLEEDKMKAKKEFEDQLRQAREDQDKLRLQKEKEAAIAAAKLKNLNAAQKALEAKLAKEAAERAKAQKSLKTSATERDTITKNLEQTEKMLKEREQMLSKLNSEIAAQQQEREKIESTFQSELEMQKAAVEENQKLVKQMEEQANLAYMAAEEAKTVQKLAVELKDQALQAKDSAEKKAANALAASYKAEVEKGKAISAMEVAKTNRIKAEANAQRLAIVIEDITQDADVAYSKNVQPELQSLDVVYSRRAGNDTLVYERQLLLLPIKIDGKVYMVFPSRQIGFYGRSDKAPKNLKMTYKDQAVTVGWHNTKENLIAIELLGYKNETYVPYASDANLGQYMPTLLALRNNGNVNFSDKVRNVAHDYFIVKRDYLIRNKDNNIEYEVSGIRGTGMHGERIVRGDQLVDLKGRLIGIANEANNIIPVTTLADWEKLEF